MASKTRPLLRFASQRSSFVSTAPRPSRFPRAPLQTASHSYHHFRNAPPPHQSRVSAIIGLAALAALGTGAWHIIDSEIKLEALSEKSHKATQAEYQDVYNAIAQRIEELDGYEDGSYGPVLLRLAWHASGTYDKETNTGGSNGATMRFDPEGKHGANNGLENARTFLEPVKAQFPWITYSDLWTLAGVTAVQEMQGPAIPWRPGRSDRDISYCTPDGRLPDGAKSQDHLRGIFYRMGFNDREIVALSGAHALGRCHKDRSGFEGPWSFSPTVMGNDYFRLLTEETWAPKKWNGNFQWEDKGSKSLMMLPTDMALVQDSEFKKWVELYARDGDVFFRDFSNAFVRLLELGVPFEAESENRFTFRTLDAQQDG